MTPRILVSNDDGIAAPGLSRLADALEALGEVFVVAPAQDQSGASHSLTLGRPLRVHRQSARWYRVEGTPTDCVNLGLFRLLERPPDLVVSGINAGFNIGEDVIYSGTVAAAREAALLGRPAMAVSMDAAGAASPEAAAELARRLGRLVIERGLPPDVMLNVNVPAGEIRGVRLTRQGRRVTHHVTPGGGGNSGGETFRIGEASSDWKDDPASDQAAVRAGWASVTPLHADLTHHDSVESLASWLAGLG